jgi:hypothetical protein
MVDTDAHSVDTFMLDRNDGLKTDCRGFRSSGLAVHVPELRHGRGSHTPGAKRQVRQGGVRPQERAPNYPITLAWSGLLILIGAGAWCVGMAIHNEALAKQQTSRPEPIYYCATGVEMPAFEPGKEMKSLRDI